MTVPAGQGTAPELLVVALPGDDLPLSRLATLARAVADGGGEVLGCQPQDEVELLEPGTPAAAMTVARWPSRGALDLAWDLGVAAVVDDLAAGRAGALALAAEGLPPEGLPDALAIPTTASVAVQELHTPPTWMVIAGSVTDTERIAAYRDVILPMMFEHGALYVAFCVGGSGVRVLRGTWHEQIFAISRWPTHASAHGFWYSERYQLEAVPLRAGIGTFQVRLLRGRAG